MRLLLLTLPEQVARHHDLNVYPIFRSGCKKTVLYA